jgi:hypothetical protein
MPLSDIFKKVQVATSVYREADRLYYDAVAEEMQQGIRDDGLWLMAFERAEGDETRTKAFYIGLRVRRLKEQATIIAASVDSASRARSAHDSSAVNGSQSAHEKKAVDDQNEGYWWPFVAVGIVGVVVFVLLIAQLVDVM